jgi:two-component system response regulator YesN
MDESQQRKKLLNKNKTKSRSLSDRVVEYVLTRNIDELAVLTVEGVAHKLNINRSHLSRTFRAEKNFTIEEFVFKIKIIRAASLLKDNADLTIKEIAKKMGFCRCDYFIRIFKRYFGITPARYRDLTRQDFYKKKV